MKNKRILILSVILTLMLIMTGCDMVFDEISLSDEDLQIHFIDVGQGDSTMIRFPNDEIALIDGGTRAGRKDLVKYLQNQNIKKIDYLIGTHPHEDHIGGLPEVIRNFKIGKIYLPNKINNTAIFEELLNEIKNKDLNIIQGKTGVEILDEEGFKFYMIAPSKEYPDINNNSIVTKIIYKDFSTIITGDAEKEAESDMIKEGHDLKANVLRVGHHGSSTSSTKEFLDQINPEYAIISLGKGNTYGHPHKETIESLEDKDISILRTDELGTIILQTDGKKMNILSQVSEGKSTEITKNPQKNNITYIGNINSKILHKGSCNSLPNKENQIIFSSREEAMKEGYEPHSICIE